MEHKVITSPSLYPQIIENKNGSIKVLDTYVNLEWLLSHFKANIRNNLMKRQWEVSLPGHYIFEEDMENSAIEKAEYLATVNGMPNRKIGKHIKTIAEEHNYHPIVECLDSNPWDGVPRLHDFIATIGSTNPELTKIIIRTWMVAAIAAIYSPGGFVCHGVLVLQGEQGQGKTGWIKLLDPINCGAVKEGAHLDPTNKDDVISAGKHWIVELGELDSTFKKDIARLKSFITSSADHIRNPYAFKASQYHRRTVFAASVNSSSYLVDETGNRRWWTVSLTGKIDFTQKFNMVQVWAEAYQLWKDGHSTELSKADQDLVNEHNRGFEKVDPIKEKLLTLYDWTATHTRDLTATQVMDELGYLKASRGELSHCGRLLKELSNNGSRILCGRTLYPVPSPLTR